MKNQLFQANKLPLQKIFSQLNSNQAFISIEQFARFCKEVKIFPDILSKLELQKILEVLQRNSEKSLKNQGIDFRSFEQSLLLISKIGFSYKKDEDKVRALILHLYNTVQERYGIQFSYNNNANNFERVLSLSPKRFKAKKPTSNLQSPSRLGGSISTRAQNLNMDKIKWDIEKKTFSGSQTVKMQSPQSSFYRSNESSVMKMKRPQSHKIPPQHKQPNYKNAQARQNSGVKSPVSFQIKKQKNEMKGCSSVRSYQNSPRNLNRMENTPPPGPNQFQFQNPKNTAAKKNLITKHTSPQSSTRFSSSTRCTPSKSEEQNSKASKLGQVEQVFYQFVARQHHIQEKFQSRSNSSNNVIKQLSLNSQASDRQEIQRNKTVNYIQKMKSMRIENSTFLKICFRAWKYYVRNKRTFF